MLSLIAGFLLGALVIIAAEAIVVYIFLNRLSKKFTVKSLLGDQQDLDPQQSLSFSYNKQGVIWILEPEKIPKEQKSKKEFLEVSPVKRIAKIKDHSLILKDSDGSQAIIDLADCIIVSVSASALPSRKWAKRYPVKVEGKNSAVYNGSRTLYIYLETSWEKESWCKALRLASRDGMKRVNWYAKLNKEFQSYLTSLNAGYPSLKKPSIGLSGEPTDRSSRIDDSSSKVRVFLKKLAKKASRSGTVGKGISTSASAREERKIGEKSRSVQDLFSATGSVKAPLLERTTNSSLDEDSAHSGNQGHVSVISDADFDDKGIDEGTLCCNLLLSRLFFDAKRNTDLRSSVQERIQRTLSNMRTPSYIGGITCTGVDLGTLPPNIHGMRVLPMDMNEVWAIEMDFEYSGGAILDVETRIEVREPDFEKGIVNKGLESSSVGEATTDLLEGFEYLGNQLQLSGEIVDEIETRHEQDNKPDKHGDEAKFSKSSSWKAAYVSRWKSILKSVANQVSQVPISLAVRISSVRGTVRLHIKPPPSDQLWISFTSMPDIDFNVDSSVGDHKITSGHVAVLLGNRFKAAIRDTLVLPNCESVCIPWMLAEKDDWIPRKAAPFVWVKQETANDTAAHEVSNCQPEEVQIKLEPRNGEQQPSSNHLEENKHEKTNIQQPMLEQSEESQFSSNRSLSASSSTSQSTSSNYNIQDLKTPLLKKDESHSETYNSSRLDSSEELESQSESMTRERQFGSFNEDPNPKRTGRRARMMDLGKKMSEKLEEKRRHLEEKSRNIVEKMRAP